MTKQFKIIIIMSIFSFLFGCNDNKGNAQVKKPKNINLEDITSRIDPEEGFVDVFLKITEETKTDTSRIYIAKGLYKNKIVGIQIEVSTNILAGIIGDKIDNKNGFVLNGVQLKSVGQESDEFVKSLAELYNKTTEKKFTKNKVSATAFSLNEKDVNLDNKDYYKLKLFFEENDESLYSEVYLNINTDKREIELHEKDEEYREPIIKVLTK
jgi:hypothetical protein